ncbi:MAG: DUF5662 family protein [Clostridia bacterium]|nr:DUF5662 family protein [Clostridia bacterium]
MNIFGHLHTINKHKFLVMKHCFRVGLYKQGLLHDLSKYSPTEFLPGIKYYQGNQSPNNVERKLNGCSLAWLHHKGRNKHHLEYWIDYSPEGDHMMTGMKMPVNYVVEMVCDRIAASQNYNKEKYTDADSWNYYVKSKEHYMLHPETRALLEKLLLMVKDEGEKATFDYMKNVLLKNYKKDKKSNVKNT